VRLPSILVIVVAVSACARGQVERPHTPSLYRSPRHVNVVVTLLLEGVAVVPA
jgi:hypothetical protein